MALGADKRLDDVNESPLKYVDYSGHESICEPKSYLERTLDMVIYGSYSDEFTWLGLGLQLLLGLTGIDAVCDIRDLTADVTVNRDTTSLSWYGTTVLDVVALAPVIGDLKYLDEVATGVKSIVKNSDELIDGGKRIARAADALHDLSKKGGTVLDGMADSLRGLVKKTVKNADMLNDAKYTDELVNAASDAGKRLDDLADAASDAGKRLDDLADSLGNKIGYEYLDDQLGNLKDKVKINQYQSAESVNDWWEARGYLSPYKEKTVVQNITLTEDTKFVRVYDGVNSNLEGGWVMRAEDIKGLTPKEIQAKFALEYEPKFIGEVELKAGDTIRLGEVGPNFGFDGGGIQIDLQQQWIGDFTELGTIEDWG